MHDNPQPPPQRRSLRRPAVTVGPLVAVALLILGSVLAGDEPAGSGATAVSSGESASEANLEAVPTQAPVGDASVAPAAPAPAVQTAPSEASATTVTSAPPEAPSVAPACRNSSDPSCGPLVWHPAPGDNQPLTITFEVVPAAPRAGEVVTVHVVAADPDAEVSTNGGSWQFFDPHATEAQVGFPLIITRGVERFGAWTPPEPRPGRLDMSFSHTFSQPGTFGFSFTALSGDEAEPGNAGRHPYANRASVAVPITVSPS